MRLTGLCLYTYVCIYGIFLLYKIEVTEVKNAIYERNIFPRELLFHL